MKLSPSKNAQTIIDAIGCPCDYFPAGTDENALLAACNSALESGKNDGYVPVIIQIDKVLAEWLIGEVSDLFDGKSAEEWARLLLNLLRHRLPKKLTNGLSECLTSMVFRPNAIITRAKKR